MDGKRYLNVKVPEGRYVSCPQCNKNRLFKEFGQEASKETIEVREERRYVDVCDFCYKQYQLKDKQILMKALKQINKQDDNFSLDQ